MFINFYNYLSIYGTKLLKIKNDKYNNMKLNKVISIKLVNDIEVTEASKFKMSPRWDRFAVPQLNITNILNAMNHDLKDMILLINISNFHLLLHIIITTFFLKTTIQANTNKRTLRFPWYIQYNNQRHRTVFSQWKMPPVDATTISRSASRNVHN